MIEFEDIIEAKKRIDEYIFHTPLVKSIGLSKTSNIYLKMENQQKLNCYKIRGALSRATELTKEERALGVTAISSGNHGASVSYAANLLGIDKCSIYVPKTTPDSKIEKAEYYGANVVKLGKNYDEAHILGLKEIEKNQGIFIDPCSDETVIAGQGSIAIEILEDNPKIDTIVVPIGGGGIITGVSIAAKAINPDIKIIGVQTEACPAMVACLEDNKLYEEYPSEESICDALVGGIGEIPFKLANSTIDDIVLVTEESIKKALQYLILEEKAIVEPAGAVGVAAIMENEKYFKNKNVAIVLTGGNINKELLKSLL